MRYVITFSIFFLLSLALNAQTTEIWGNFAGSNNEGLGSIFKIDEASSNASIVKTFERYGDYSTGLTKASDGNYYGIWRQGGAHGEGVIYKIDPSDNSTSVIYDFVNPIEQTSDLQEIQTGELWGVASNAGTNGAGIVYKYNIATKVFSVVFNFSTINTDHPNGKLVQAPNGKWYGVARGIGHFSRRGCIYEMDLTTNTLTKRFSFLPNNFDGWYPLGAFVLAPNGRIYGTCGSGGSFNGSGTLFEYNYQTHNVIKRRSFTTLDAIGDQPGFLFMAQNGKIYGGTGNGGANGDGSVYEYTPGTYTCINKFDHDSVYNWVVLSYDEGNGRILGGNYTQQVSPQESHIISFDPSSGNVTTLQKYISTVSFFDIHKEANNRYIAGGDLVMEFDSSFSNGTYIARGYSTVEGGDFKAPFVLGNDNKLYGYGGFYPRPEFYRIDPITHESEIFYHVFDRDSIQNITGKLLKHPNGKFYAAFSNSYRGFNVPPNFVNYSGILEIDPVLDTVKVVFNFKENFADIKSLVLDQYNNFYGLAREGSGSFGRDSYFFKVPSSLDTTIILKTWYTSTDIFYNRDIMADSNLIVGHYRSSGSSRMMLYEVDQDTLYTKYISSNSTVGTFVKGEPNNYYGIEDDEIIKYNYQSNTVSTVVDLSSNGSITGTSPRTLTFKNGVLYGINIDGPTSNSNNAVFSYDLNASQNALKLIHEFNASDGTLDFDQIGTNLNIIDVCRPSEKPILISNFDTICKGGQIQIRIDSGEINSGDLWAIYNDTLSSPLLTDSTGVFQLNIDSNSTYYVRGEGSCFQYSSFARIDIVVDSNYFDSTHQSIAICRGDLFVRPAGDTLFNVQQSFNDTSLLQSSISGCDSIVYTDVQVNTIDTKITRKGVTLTAAESNASYKWINCRTNTVVPFQTNQTFNVSSNGLYQVEISKNGCVDSSQCFSFVRTPPSPILYVPNGNNVIVTNQPRMKGEGGVSTVESSLTAVEVFPNPTLGMLTIRGLEETSSYEIIIRNVQGQLIEERVVVDQQQVRLNIKAEAGIYIIQLSNQERQQTHFKVIKN